ncbi:MAG: CotH kinase family protein [Oligoflexales bacterium]
MDSEQQNRLNSTVWEKTPVPCKVKVNGETYSSQINYAGKSTIDDLKKSYTIQFDDKTYKGHHSYRLSAQNLDPTLLKAQLGFEIFRSLGIPSPDAEPAAVYLNREYIGLFQLIEPVDIDFFRRRNLDFSSLFKAQYGNADFDKKMLAKIDQGFDIEFKPKSYHELTALIETLENSRLTNDLKDVESMVDVDNSMAYLAASVALNNWDGYQNNFFLYRDTKTKQFAFVPWDLDRTLELEASNMFEPDITIWGKNKLFAFILTDLEHKRAYLDLLEQIITKSYPLSKMFAIIEENSSKIRRAYEADRMLNHKTSLFVEKERLKQTIELWYGSLEQELKRQQQDSVEVK